MDLNRREEIFKLRENGFSYNEIAKKLSCNKSIVAYYLNPQRFSIEKIKEKEKKEKEYEEFVCNLVKESENINQVCKALGKKATNTNYEQIKKIILKYQVDISHFTSDVKYEIHKRYTFDEIFRQNSEFKNKSLLKRKLINLKIKEPECEKCHNKYWLDSIIPLQIHHINGDKNDNRVENLQLLCPNCHTLTENYCGKNKKKKSNKEKTLTSKRHYKCNEIPTIEKICEYANESCCFTYIASKFGITDNALRRWCKKLNLPYHTSELKKYIQQTKQKIILDI